MKNSFINETNVQFGDQPFSGKIIVAEFDEVVSTRGFGFDEDVLRTLHYHQKYEGDLIVITADKIVENWIQEVMRIRHKRDPDTCPDPEAIKYIEKSMLSYLFGSAHTIFSARPATYMPTAHNQIINDDLRERKAQQGSLQNGVARHIK